MTFSEKRIAKLLKDKKIGGGYKWIDIYNMTVSDIAGCVQTGVFSRGLYFISEYNGKAIQDNRMGEGLQGESDEADNK